MKKNTNELDVYFQDDSGQLLRGNSLEVLGKLQQTRSESVDLVYIDPPFATNSNFRVSENGGRTSTVSSSKSDVLAYSDKLIGQDYLDFLKPILVDLSRVMSKNASIYLHIDYKIGHYVKVLMDEVFGIHNFKNDITRIKCNPKNFHRKSYGNVKDMILFYARGDYTWNSPTSTHSDTDISRLFPKIDNLGRRYTTNPLHAPGETVSGESGREWRGALPPAGRHWRFSFQVMDELQSSGLIEWSKNGNPRKIVFADEQRKKGKKLQDIWEFKDPMYPEYPTQKNIELLDLIISASSNPGDTVLDCFAGSGTTLVSAKGLGRKWIGIDQSSAALKVATGRLKKIVNV